MVLARIIHHFNHKHLYIPYYKVITKNYTVKYCTQIWVSFAIIFMHLLRCETLEIYCMSADFDALHLHKANCMNKAG